MHDLTINNIYLNWEKLSTKYTENPTSEYRMHYANIYIHTPSLHYTEMCTYVLVHHHTWTRMLTA